MKKNLFIIGVGGQAKMAASIAETKFNIKGFIDLNINNSRDDIKFLSKKILNLKFFTQKYKNENLFIAVGENKDRKKIYNHLKKYNFKYPNLIHKSAIIHKSVKLGMGNIIMPNVVINPQSVIMDFAIINTSSIVEHDCKISSFSSISPRATLCGNCFIDEGSFIGANTCIIQNILVGKWSVVGASSVVIKNISNQSLNFGSPSKEIKKIDSKYKVFINC